MTLPPRLMRRGLPRTHLDLTKLQVDKDERAWSAYEQIVAPLRTRSSRMLLLGPPTLDDIRAWTQFVPTAVIHVMTPLQSAGELGSCVIAHQGDPADLAAFEQMLFGQDPILFDLIIDDASHIASKAIVGFDRLFESNLAPGGWYCFEDWGVSFYAGFPDGALAPHVLTPSSGAGARTPSHDAGLAGLGKALVDHVAARDFAAASSIAKDQFFPVRSVWFQEAVLAVEKW